jgi:hypothetical protein
MSTRRYWIGVVSKDDVNVAVASGFVQLGHGKAGRLERMRAGDGFLFYSPRASYPDGPPLKQFTAIGKVGDAPLVHAERPDGEAVFRRGVDFLPAEPTPIRPLIPVLTFIRSKEHWGAAFRFGFLPVPEQDFERIASAIGRPVMVDFPRADPVPAGAP